MRFSEFIRANVHEIATEWENFVATLLPEEEFSSSVLRNSIEELLEKIANDMEQTQSKEQQSHKSKGQRSSKELEDVILKSAYMPSEQRAG